MVSPCPRAAIPLPLPNPPQRRQRGIDLERLPQRRGAHRADLVVTQAARPRRVLSSADCVHRSSPRFKPPVKYALQLCQRGVDLERLADRGSTRVYSIVLPCTVQQRVSLGSAPSPRRTRAALQPSPSPVRT